jgi:Flp pilus assembly secretin CpaC
MSRLPWGLFAALSLLLTPLSTASRSDEMAIRPIAKSIETSTVVKETGSSLQLELNFARVIALRAPARTIVVGNPAIADASIDSERTLVLTGKAVGTTNIVVLGAGNDELLNVAVDVRTSSAGQVIVHSGATQQAFSCIGPCRPVVPTDAAPPANR